jgi:hypothetical protein
MAVMVGVIVGMVVRHRKMLHYNITGVHVLAVARPYRRPREEPCDEAIHFSASSEMDCFASLAMTWTQLPLLAAHPRPRLSTNFPPSLSEAQG